MVFWETDDTTGVLIEQRKALVVVNVLLRVVAPVTDNVEAKAVVPETFNDPPMVTPLVVVMADDDSNELIIQSSVNYYYNE